MRKREQIGGASAAIAHDHRHRWIISDIVEYGAYCACACERVSKFNRIIYSPPSKTTHTTGTFLEPDSTTFCEIHSSSFLRKRMSAPYLWQWKVIGEKMKAKNEPANGAIVDE